MHLNMSKYMLEVNKLKKTFYHKNGLVKVLDNINLKVKRGELIECYSASEPNKNIFH